MSLQHVQVPNNMTKDLSPKDLLVYVTLKRHINDKTKESFPSLACISKECGYSIPTIRKSIECLSNKGFITIKKQGRKQIYSFSTYKNFEPFSYDFLDKEEIESNEKAYLISLQQFMIKDSEGFGKVSFSNDKVGELLNISSKTVDRLDKSLKDKGFLTIVKTNKKNPETGIFINEKFFHLDELGQNIIWALSKHEDIINENSKDIKVLLNRINALEKLLKNEDGTITM